MSTARKHIPGTSGVKTGGEPPNKSIDLDRLSIGLSNHELCTRCGSCTGACPTEAITVGKDRYPELQAAKCIDCGACKTACPGDTVHYADLARHTFGAGAAPEDFDGHVIARYVAHAADDRIREGGAGGGVVTALLWDQLKHGDVEGAIATRMNPERPWEGEYFIARTYEDMLLSQGSRYTIIPLNAVFAEIRQFDGPFAYAALPCQIHGYRNLEQINEEIASKIHSVVGLFCGGALDPSLIVDLVESKGISVDDLKDFQFRGGKWPGKMRAVLKNGEIRDLHYSNYKDGAYNYFTALYMPKRCQTCMDGSAYFSDVSVGDAWTRDSSGNYAYPRHSRLLVRTEKGHDLVKRAAERGTLVIKDVTKDPNYQTHRLHTKRKGVVAPIRVERYKSTGRAAPEYDLPVPDVTFKERMTERIVTSILDMATIRAVRVTVLRLVTSKLAIPLIKYRQFVKKRKYRGRS
jgi:coenzyme F420 hydrogenase subunit beta